MLAPMHALRALALPIALAVFALAPTGAAAADKVNVYALALQVDGAPGAPGYPAPTGLDVRMDMSEQGGQRPESLAHVSLALSGTTLRGGQIPTCSVPDEYTGPEACPPASIVGSVEMFFQIGPPGLPSDTSLSCYLSGTLVNFGATSLGMWLTGGPVASSDPSKNCPATVGQYLSAKVTVEGANSTVSWYFPPNLEHPAGLDSPATLIHLQFAKPATNAGYTTTTTCPGAALTARTDWDIETTVTASGFACLPAAGQCPVGQTGTPPNCTTPGPATCPVGQTGTPPNCIPLEDSGTSLPAPTTDTPPFTSVPIPPVARKASIDVSLKGPKACVKKSFSVSVVATVAHATFASTSVLLDGKRLKTLSGPRGAVKIPASALKKRGSSHRITATARTTGGLVSNAAKTTFAVCKKTSRK